MPRAVDNDTLEKARIAEANGLIATARILYLRAGDKAGAKRCTPKRKRSR